MEPPFCHILQKKVSQQICTFVKNVLPYPISGFHITWWCRAVMLVLLIVGSWEMEVWGGFQRHNVNTKFHKSPPPVCLFDSCRQRTDGHEQLWMRSFRIHPTKYAQRLSAGQWKVCYQAISLNAAERLDKIWPSNRFKMDRPAAHEEITATRIPAHMWNARNL
jgi:hypothetical protein